MAASLRQHNWGRFLAVASCWPIILVKLRNPPEFRNVAWGTEGKIGNSAYSPIKLFLFPDIKFCLQCQSSYFPILISLFSDRYLPILHGNPPISFIILPIPWYQSSYSPYQYSYSSLSIILFPNISPPNTISRSTFLYFPISIFLFPHINPQKRLSQT